MACLGDEDTEVWGNAAKALGSIAASPHADVRAALVEHNDQLRPLLSHCLSTADDQVRPAILAAIASMES